MLLQGRFNILGDTSKRGWSLLQVHAQWQFCVQVFTILENLKLNTRTSILGGAKISWQQSIPITDNRYYTVALADVYVGLSDEFALHSRVTHRDLVSN